MSAPNGLPVGNPSGLTSLEIAVGRLLGTERREPLDSLPREVDLDAVLDDILTPALASRRCFVAFSGGRESSWLLAAAVATARRRGLPDPIPVTLQHGVVDPRVTRRRERVVAHLNLSDWERVGVDHELELLGPNAVRVLESSGLTFPTTLYVFVPILDLAPGGWVLSGGGLTDFFLYWRFARVAELVFGQRRPSRRDVRALANALLPRAARAALLRRRGMPAYPWLRPHAAAEVDRRMLGLLADVPIGFAAALARQRTHRCHQGMRTSLDAVAAAASADASMPFRDDRFIAALAAAGGRQGFGDRARAISHVAGHLLPADLLVRSDGRNAQPMFGEASRSFVENWSGVGLDDDLIDVDVLRSCWQGDFHWGSATLLQLAFATERASASATV